MIEKDAEWILPENLMKQQEKEKRSVDLGLFKGEGDFGSYYGLNKGVNSEWVKPHGIIDKNEALKYAVNVGMFCRSKQLILGGNILDVGCGTGAITGALAEICPGANVTGLDISTDAVCYAQKEHIGAKFYCRSAEDLGCFPDEYFDVIHCKEFYPFTRTNDIEYQSKYFELFYKKLKKRGFVVLVMLEPGVRGLGTNRKKIKPRLLLQGYGDLLRSPLVLFSVAGFLHKMLKDKSWLAYKQPLSLLFFLFTRARDIMRKDKRSNYIYVVQKQ